MKPRSIITEAISFIAGMIILLAAVYVCGGLMEVGL